MNGHGPLGIHAPLIGIIGPIGAGKSTVAARLASGGAVVIDADDLTRELMAPGTPVTAAILSLFGDRYRRPDGSLDRVELGRTVFSDPERLAELESIVHPAVGEVERVRICAADLGGPPAIVIEAVKLVEAGHAVWCDEVWLVVCKPETQLARLVGRGMAESDARQRIAAQEGSMPLWRAAATRVVHTDAPLAQVNTQVDALLDGLRSTGRS